MVTGMPGHNQKREERRKEKRPVDHVCDICGDTAHVFYNDGEQLCIRCDEEKNR